MAAGPRDEVDLYVRRALINNNLSRIRRKRVAHLLTPVLPDSLRHTSGGHAETVEQRTALFAALADLTPRQRAVVVLRYWEDLTETETARVLDCSVGTVKSHARRGLTALRTHPRLAPAPGTDTGTDAAPDTGTDTGQAPASAPPSPAPPEPADDPRPLSRPRSPLPIPAPTLPFPPAPSDQEHVRDLLARAVRDVVPGPVPWRPSGAPVWRGGGAGRRACRRSRCWAPPRPWRRSWS